ncbi:hypothetical protein B1B04_07240 [Lysinibacillus sp. KCTC 33748]|uniref:hypothetical protein n=1 Tax=unclassified Lysinibacillus TaxID=2636778 RepID=UPI0009A66AF5|nr:MULTISPECIES: hypothetical protein [unclassified Lysinibacillus]OXS75503.1 hypothetical protein B1B04_07240 [Lysinibacillus sp. KCTC 33748]SKB54381.1 hypothetical protein SAMN06295926_103313 [Lysinibacillus sp. AC-3]
MAKQMKKYIAVTTASFMAMQLAACGNTESQTVEGSSAPSTDTNNVTEENNSAATASDDLQSVYDSDMANACDEWKESDDGSFECLDENSPHYAHHFFNGLMYATTGALIGSAIYKSRNLKNGTDREDKSGGSGSAMPRSTNSNTSESKNTNGITTNGSQNSSGATSNSSNNSTTNSSHSNTSGSNSYSSGKRSFSNSSDSSSNSSYSNHSSASTGKSGFGSGGASRGGSSSS